LEFVDTVRVVERAIAATRRGDSVPEELDAAPLVEITEEEWRAHWPSAVSGVDGESADVADEPDDTAEDTELASVSKASRGGKKRGGRR
jgi:XTP/dITP diphosphohydrolase